MEGEGSVESLEMIRDSGHRRIILIDKINEFSLFYGFILKIKSEIEQARRAGGTNFILKLLSQCFALHGLSDGILDLFGSDIGKTIRKFWTSKR